LKRKRKDKKSNFVSNEKSSFEVYRKGAFVGGLIGGGVGLLLGKRIILSTIIGIIAGGYIAYEVNKDDASILSVKKYKD
jgi:uncharacterized protein YcfJ